MNHSVREPDQSFHRHAHKTIIMNDSFDSTQDRGVIILIFFRQQGLTPSFSQMHQKTITRTTTLTMSNPQLRKAALRLSSGLSRRSVVPALFSAIPQKRQFSVKLQKWQELGYVDDKGLTIFDTLHEMQVRSCQTYGENRIFGTYSPESQKFEWMTFADYEEKVNKCRAVLKDLGKHTLIESCIKVNKSLCFLRLQDA